MNNTIGVIDLGSNTARLVVYEQDPQGIVTEVDNIKRVLRLSDHLQDGQLEPEGVAKTLTCLRQFQELLAARGVKHMIGVATAAVRQAKNGQALLAAIEQETGLAMRVLSGEEEAFYGYLAVMNSMNVEEGITIDIGGGSTEVTYFHNRQLQESISFPFGIVSLTRSFFHGDIPADQELSELRNHLANAWATCPWIRNKECPVIAIGGTARNLAKIHQRSIGYTMGSLHQYVLTQEQVGGIMERLRLLPLEERRQVPGLSKDRADVILAGITVFDSLMTAVSSQQLLVSNKGLRDGVLYETVWGKEPPVTAAGIRERSIAQFMNRYQVNKVHSAHVKDLALSLFDQLQHASLHPFGSAERNFLEAAAMLHDVGRTINVYETSEHTFYLLSHVLLAGFTHRERLLIAMIASYKSNKMLQSQMALHPDIVLKQDKNLVEKLGHILLLARMLDRSLTQTIKSIRLVTEQNERFVLECYGTRTDLLEYALLEEPLQKFSKAWKLPLSFHAMPGKGEN